MHICIWSLKKRGENCAEGIFEKLTAEYFQNLRKALAYTSKKLQQTPSRKK